MNASAGARRVALRGEVLSVGDAELDRLLEALVRLDLRAAGAVAEHIAALRLAGAEIRLTPTEGEIAALGVALSTLAAEALVLGPGLARLASVCSGDVRAGEALRV